MSLQRSIVQIKDLLEDPEFYARIGSAFSVMGGEGVGAPTAGLAYRVTDDAGNGTLADDVNNTDYSGQEGALGTCAICESGVSVTFYHKGTQYAYAGPRPASYGVGCSDTMSEDYLIPIGIGDHGALNGLLDDDHPQYHNDARGDVRYYTKAQQDATDSAQDAALQAHIDDKANPHETDWDNLLGKPATFPPDPHTHVEADITDLDRVRWRGNWLQQTYEINDMVIDQGAGTYWTMVANAQTAQRAAPQAADDPQYSQPETPTFVVQQHTGVVESGMEWTTSDAFILIGYQVWVPTLSANTNYVIRTFAYSEPDGSDIIYREISEPLLVEGGWTTIAVQRNLIFSGTTIGIRINALNSGADTTVGPFDWARESNSNNADPGPGGWRRRNQNNIVRIHEIDDSGVNRGPNGDGSLEGIIAGSTIQIVSQNDATESATYTTTGAATYGGGVYEFPVTLDDTGAGGEPPVGQVCAITITVPIPSPTDYVEADPSEDTLGGVGFLELDGVAQPGADLKSYGVRILADAVTRSTDWDIVSWVGSGGGGGGGGGEPGATTFLDLSDTPADYAGSAGLFAAVNSTADGLEFVTAGGLNPDQFVEVAGDTMTGTLRVGDGPNYVNIVPGANSKRVTVADESGANPARMNMDTDGGLGRLFWEANGDVVRTMAFQSDGTTVVPGNITCSAATMVLGASNTGTLALTADHATLRALGSDARFSGALFFDTNWGNTMYIQGRHFVGVSADIYMNVGGQEFTFNNSGELKIPWIYKGPQGSEGAVLKSFEGGNRYSIAWRAASQVIASIDGGGAEVLLGTASDYRIKKEVPAHLDGTDLVNRLRPIWYTTKEAKIGKGTWGADDDTLRLGLLAHEVQAEAPWLVLGEKDGDMLQSVDYAGLVVPLIDAVKRLTARVEELEAKLSE